MKNKSPHLPGLQSVCKPILNSFIGLLFIFNSHAQAVTEVITDFGGFWKSSTASVNPVKPNNAHNLLSFTFNGNRYSTGVNDGLLAARGENFTSGDFWALPVVNLTGAVTSNTKVGFGALYDGVLNGPGYPAPAWGIETYLTDGIKGLGLGTCIANLPVGNLNFSISTINPSAIGDGIPDILITQVADPTINSYDRYSFNDVNGNRVGNYKDVNFNTIAATGNWTADFYEARTNPLVLTSGFTQTDRPIRLWAADFSDFGITAANYLQIKAFTITLSGNSDIAFVAYNRASVDLQQVLPVQYTFFTATKGSSHVALNWQTASEKETAYYEVERSNNGSSFSTIGRVAATNTGVGTYSFLDANPLNGTGYYRLKEVDRKAESSYSKVVKIEFEKSQPVALAVYPNPAKDNIYAVHPLSNGSQAITIYNSAGVPLKKVVVQEGIRQTKLVLQAFAPGHYFLSYHDKIQTLTTHFTVR